ncbi:hypothetical protein LTR50_003942 [Elasticomyces elasticus]|nr:hypothetical protein LTR50_003942 [Elasticomyces elasticus]
MTTSKFDRLIVLLGEENIPKPVYKPALTDEELRAAAPDGTKSQHPPLDPVSFDHFYGPAYVNKNLEVIVPPDDEDQELASQDSDVDLDCEPQRGRRQSRRQPGLPSSATTMQRSKAATFLPAGVSVDGILDSASESAPMVPPSDTGFTPDDRLGQLSPPGFTFTPIVAASKFPYKFVDRQFSQPIASRFFDANKFWSREWDLYYVHPAEGETTKPLILIPETQFQALIYQVNIAFPELNFNITQELRDFGLALDFPDHPALRPRWLGHSTSKDHYAFLEKCIPDRRFRFAGEPKGMYAPEVGSLEAFKAKMEAIAELNKNRKKGDKSKKKQALLGLQSDSSGQVKRVQRYLRLRPRVQGGGHLDSGPVPASPSPPLPAVDPSRLSPYDFDSSAVFICIDCESYERNHSLITEIGIATLDTNDIKNIPPGVKGEAWFAKIRARHIRIKEHLHLENRDFVQGCAESFEFGKSEIVSLKDAPQVIGSCFKEPFSAPGSSEPADLLDLSDTQSTTTTTTPESPMRNVIILGHDTQQDISYLHTLGYSPLNLSTLLEVMDTRAMYQAHTRNAQPRSLANILYDFDLVGWNLHNAGNDAVYTMHVMLAMAVQGAQDRDGAATKEEKMEQSRERTEEIVADAVEREREEQQGWDMWEDGDGGAPLKPEPLSASRGQYAGRGGRGGGNSRERKAAQYAQDKELARRTEAMGLASASGGTPTGDRHILDM